MHLVAIQGQKNAVDSLLAKGGDVNVKSKDGLTPLHMAAVLGHKEVVELLLGRWADVNAREDKSGTTPLHGAVGTGRKEVAETLLARGADINARDKDNCTPLDKANEISYTELVKLLVKRGAQTLESAK